MARLTHQAGGAPIADVKPLLSTPIPQDVELTYSLNRYNYDDYSRGGGNSRILSEVLEVITNFGVNFIMDFNPNPGSRGFSCAFLTPCCGEAPLPYGLDGSPLEHLGPGDRAMVSCLRCIQEWPKEWFRDRSDRTFPTAQAELIATRLMDPLRGVMAVGALKRQVEPFFEDAPAAWPEGWTEATLGC